MKNILLVMFLVLFNQSIDFLQLGAFNGLKFGQKVFQCIKGLQLYSLIANMFTHITCCEKLLEIDMGTAPICECVSKIFLVGFETPEKLPFGRNPVAPLT